MQLPFSVEEFFAVIVRYNEAVWPAQVLLVLIALGALAAIAWRRPWSGRFVAAALALLWVWIGVVYHFVFFTSINPLAWAFGALSLAGAAVFAWQGVVKRRLQFEWHADLRDAVGLALVLFALVLYPLWSARAGHAYPRTPTFGLPCPTTIFTIGLLALASGAAVRQALVAPILWSLIGGQAAFLLDVPPDLGLVVAGVIGLGLALRGRHAPPGVAAHA